MQRGSRAGSIVIGLVAAGLLLSACAGPGGTPASASLQTVTLQRGDLETTVSSSGTVAAVADLSLDATGGGTVKQIHVKPGDRVKAGQPLISLDTKDLELQVMQAEANLASAQAKYEQAKAGATHKDIEQAEAAVRSAEAKYAQTVQGTTIAQDIENAQAAVRSAEAKLEATRAGTTTDQDIANAEAALRSAEAKLEAARNGTASSADIAGAEASVRSAEAKLAELLAGPAPGEADSAVQKINQAKDNRAKLESQLANAKEQARIAMEQAADSVRSAQAAYGAAKLVYDEAGRTGKDPNINCVSDQPCNNKLTDTKLRQYKADYETKQLALSQAEATLEARRLAYEDSKKQEIAGLQAADSQILDAQAQYDTLMAGPSSEQVAQAQAAVDQAKANLDKLTQPAKETDIVQAEAAVDQARANLEKLRQPARAADIAQAQAAVDQARANLEKLQRGPTDEELTIAQASVDQAMATLNDLQAGPKASDLTVALAAVKQNEAARDLQAYKLSQATLTAPFDGVVAALNAVLGQQAGGSTPLLTLVDDSLLRVDVRVPETDMPRLRLGQQTRITFEAMPEQTVQGVVTFVAPKATVEQNVVSYLVTITLDRPDPVVRPGMTATVSIITDRKQDVLLLPNRAIRTQGQERLVEVRYKGEQFQVPVQIGMVGDSMSEVISGLQEGDTVVINTQPTNRIMPNVTGPGAPARAKP